MTRCSKRADLFSGGCHGLLRTLCMSRTRAHTSKFAQEWFLRSSMRRREFTVLVGDAVPALGRWRRMDLAGFSGRGICSNVERSARPNDEILSAARTFWVALKKDRFRFPGIADVPGLADRSPLSRMTHLVISLLRSKASFVRSKAHIKLGASLHLHPACRC